MAISQMFNHVQLYVHWMHLLDTRICRYTYVTPTVVNCDQDRCKMILFNLESELYCVQVRCMSNKIWTQITPFFICSASLCVGWLVVWSLTTLWNSISVYIGPSLREREKEKRNDRREKQSPSNPHPHLLQVQ